MTTPLPRNVVIVRAGRRSTHRSWLEGDTPLFDLILAPYEELPASLTAGAHEVLLIPGTKVDGWHRLFAMRPDLLERYDRIALLDDDLVMGASELNRAFALGAEQGLSLWQPSLTWGSHFSYGITLNNPTFMLRFVNYIEMMCPFFTSSHLKDCLPLFALGLETGIDRLWCRLHEHPDRAYAILDAVIVEHSRPVGQNRAAQGFVGSKAEYQTVLDDMEEAIGVRFRGPVAYAGITRQGKMIRGRVPMALRSLWPLAGWRGAAHRSFFRQRMVDHVRHNLTRPVDNAPLALSEIAARWRASSQRNSLQ